MTRLEYLQSIADPEIRHRALRARKPEKDNDTLSSLSGAITGMNVWADTKEGHTFWSSFGREVSIHSNHDKLFDKFKDSIRESSVRERILRKEDIHSNYQIY